MMKRTILIFSLVGTLAIASTAYAQELKFEADLSGAAERPNPVVTEGVGEAKFETDGTSVAFELKWDDLSTPAVAGHIHCGGPEQSGSVGVTLLASRMGTEGEVHGTFTAPDSGNGCGWDDLADVLGAMTTGTAYVNVHTTQNPRGEIRGQVTSEQLKFEADLSGAAERPTPVVTDGVGEAKFETDGTSVAFELEWDDLSTPAFAAHIHCGGPEESGPVGVTLFAGAMDTEGEVEGTFTAPDPGNACGWEDLADVLEAMSTG